MDLVQACCQYIIVNEETRVSCVCFILCQERNHGAKTRLCKHPWGIGRDTKVSCTTAVSEGECGRWGTERERERERKRERERQQDKFKSPVTCQEVDPSSTALLGSILLTDWL